MIIAASVNIFLEVQKSYFDALRYIDKRVHSNEKFAFPSLKNIMKILEKSQIQL